MKTIRTNYLLVAALSILTVSCTDNTTDTTKTKQKPNASPKIRKEDTLSDATIASINSSIQQFSFTSLLEFMPQEIEGYTLSEEPINGEDGGIGKSGARYFSFASKTFVKKKEKIMVEIIDYSTDTTKLLGLLNMYGFNSAVDNNIMKSEKITLESPSTKAVSNQFKMEKTAKLIVGVSDKVLIVITGMENNNIEQLKKVADKIDIRKMVNDINNRA